MRDKGDPGRARLVCMHASRRPDFGVEQTAAEQGPFEYATSAEKTKAVGNGSDIKRARVRNFTVMLSKLYLGIHVWFRFFRHFGVELSFSRLAWSPR